MPQALAMSPERPIEMDVSRCKIDFRIVLLLQRTVQENCAMASAKAWAQRLRLSYSRFEHLFKNGAGISASRYITLLRLERARLLLETTSLSIKEIMYTCGIADRRVFNRHFRRKFGKTPTQLRCEYLSRKSRNLAEIAS